MATTLDLHGLLSTLTESLDAASTALPESVDLTPHSNGISLFDTKSELLLSYLENLVFLILMKIRNFNDDSTSEESESFSDQVRKRLVELRIYLERGVRPLESKLKYQVDKLLAAAAEADTPNQVNGGKKSKIDGNGSGSDAEVAPAPAEASELSYRPNPSAFARSKEASRSYIQSDKPGIYKPPRITPTALPTTDRATQKLTRPRKSRTVDDFIREELTDAPMAETSIGAGNGLRGKEREREEERRAYEEQRLVRLPEEKRGKKRRVGGGGEDLDVGFTGLGGGVEFGELKGRKKRRDQGGVMGMGEKWERRVQKGIKRKR